MSAHWHAMDGSYGCLPDNNDVYETRRDAVEGSAFLLELGRKRTAILRRDSYLDLSPKRDGADYVEVVECDEQGCVALRDWLDS